MDPKTKLQQFKEASEQEVNNDSMDPNAVFKKLKTMIKTAPVSDGYMNQGPRQPGDLSGGQFNVTQPDIDRARMAQEQLMKNKYGPQPVAQPMSPLTEQQQYQQQLQDFDMPELGDKFPKSNKMVGR